MVQLESYRERFEALGVNVAGMTIDGEEMRAEFHMREDLGYPLLQDFEATHANALGIRNEDYGPDHIAYGVPHPGIIYLAPEGEVLAKFAEPGYKDRPPMDAVLAEIRKISQL